MKKTKKETNLGVIYIGEQGLVRVSYGGKVLLLLLTGVLSLWVLVLILVNWDTFINKGDTGKAVAYLAAISMSLLVLTVFEKYFALKFYINSSRQIAVLLYFITVFILIFHFEPNDIKSKSGTENLKVYENPVQMTYIYILFYCFGIIWHFNV